MLRMHDILIFCRIKHKCSIKKPYQIEIYFEFLYKEN